MPQKLMWHNIIKSTKSQNGFNFIYVINYKLAKSYVSQLFGTYYYRPCQQFIKTISTFHKVIPHSCWKPKMTKAPRLCLPLPVMTFNGFGLYPDNSICCRWHYKARMASLHEDHANPISINRPCYSQI